MNLENFLQEEYMTAKKRIVFGDNCSVVEIESGEGMEIGGVYKLGGELVRCIGLF